MKRMRFSAILLAGLISISMTACTSVPTCPTLPPAPAKPQLPSLTQTPDGGMRLDRADTERLGRYILNLERGYH